MYDDEYQVSQAPAPNYEFTPQENSVIDGLLTSVRIVAVGWFLLALLVAGLGALVVVQGGGGAIVSIPLFGGGAIMFFLGRHLWSASNSMQVITKSEGNDIPNLLAAVTHIGEYFKMILYVILIVFILALIGVIIGAATAAG